MSKRKTLLEQFLGEELFQFYCFYESNNTHYRRFNLGEHNYKPPRKNSRLAIKNAFSWERTKQGSLFWGQKHTDWCIFLDKRKMWKSIIDIG